MKMISIHFLEHQALGNDLFQLVTKIKNEETFINLITEIWIRLTQVLVRSSS
jgi:hypothetical protein